MEQNTTRPECINTHTHLYLHIIELDDMNDQEKKNVKRMKFWKSNKREKRKSQLVSIPKFYSVQRVFFFAGWFQVLYNHLNEF